MNFKHGSFGVAFVRDDTITVGIESRITGENVSTDTACKVFESNGIVFALVGTYQHYNFSTMDEAKRILALKLTFDQKVRRFDTTIINFMSSWVDSGAYRTQFLTSEASRNLAAIRALFATFIGGAPVLYYHCYIPTVSGSHITVTTKFEEHKIENIPFACQPLGGDSAFVMNYMRGLDNAGMMQNAPPEDIIRDFINTAAQTNPNRIGGPIDIVQLTRNGKAHWIQRKENCH